MPDVIRSYDKNYSLRFIDLYTKEVLVVRRAISFFLVLSVLLAAACPAFAASHEPERAMERIDPAREERFFSTGLIPEEYELSYPSREESSEKNDSAALPNAYDSREAGLQSPVKNQSRLGLCWAFAAYGVVEANMLQNGLGVQDLSELHMAY